MRKCQPAKSGSAFAHRNKRAGLFSHAAQEDFLASLKRSSAAQDQENRVQEIRSPAEQLDSFSFNSVGAKVEGGGRYYTWLGNSLLTKRNGGTVEKAFAEANPVATGIGGVGYAYDSTGGEFAREPVFLMDQVGTAGKKLDSNEAEISGSDRNFESPLFDAWGKNYDAGNVPDDERIFNSREHFHYTVGSASLELIDQFARWYSPELGRFMTPDPLATSVGMPKSIGLSRNPIAPLFNFVGNQPSLRLDPFGLQDSSENDVSQADDENRELMDWVIQEIIKRVNPSICGDFIFVQASGDGSPQETGTENALSAEDIARSLSSISLKLARKEMRPFELTPGENRLSQCEEHILNIYNNVLSERFGPDSGYHSDCPSVFPFHDGVGLRAPFCPSSFEGDSVNDVESRIEQDEVIHDRSRGNCPEGTVPAKQSPHLRYIEQLLHNYSYIMNECQIDGGAGRAFSFMVYWYEDAIDDGRFCVGDHTVEGEYIPSSNTIVIDTSDGIPLSRMNVQEALVSNWNMPSCDSLGLSLQFLAHLFHEYVHSLQPRGIERNLASFFYWKWHEANAVQNTISFLNELKQQLATCCLAQCTTGNEGLLSRIQTGINVQERYRPWLHPAPTGTAGGALWPDARQYDDELPIHQGEIRTE